MSYPIPVHGRPFSIMYDYFIYTAAEGSRRPSLERIPSVDGTMADFRALFTAGAFNLTRQRLRRLDGLDLGVLRRGNKSALVELQIDRFSKFEVEIHVFYTNRGTNQWMVRHPKIEFGDSGVDLEDLVIDWNSDIVMAVGDYLCWVDYCFGGILVCDVFRSCSQLRYIPFPAKLPNLNRKLHGGSLAELYQSVCVNEENALMKFFMVDPLDGKMPNHKFTPASGFKVTSWTLKITENMSWVMDFVLNSDYLWKLDEFEQFPHMPLELPIVSMGNPNIICFVLSEQKGRQETGYSYDETRVVAMDMSTMTVLSSYKYKSKYVDHFLSLELPKYLKLLVPVKSMVST